MEFYILQNNLKEGPYSLEELGNKNINTNTLVWRTGFKNWTPVKDVPELSDLLSNLPPIPPGSQPVVKTWLAESILVTIFCCLPFGIVGIINASRVSSLYVQGNYEEAKKVSSNAGKWTKIGFFIGLASIIIYILFYVIMILLILNN